MQAKGTKTAGVYGLYLESRSEVFQVAKAMGAWRFSAFKLIASVFTESSDGLVILLEEPDLRTIEQRLNPSSPELSQYVNTMGEIVTAPECIPATMNKMIDGIYAAITLPSGGKNEYTNAT